MQSESHRVDSDAPDKLLPDEGSEENPNADPADGTDTTNAEAQRWGTRKRQMIMALGVVLFVGLIVLLAMLVHRRNTQSTDHPVVVTRVPIIPINISPSHDEHTDDVLPLIDPEHVTLAYHKRLPASTGAQIHSLSMAYNYLRNKGFVIMYWKKFSLHGAVSAPVERRYQLANFAIPFDEPEKETLHFYENAFWDKKTDTDKDVYLVGVRNLSDLEFDTAVYYYNSNRYGFVVPDEDNKLSLSDGVEKHRIIRSHGGFANPDNQEDGCFFFNGVIDTVKANVEYNYTIQFWQLKEGEKIKRLTDLDTTFVVRNSDWSPCLAAGSYLHYAGPVGNIDDVNTLYGIATWKWSSSSKMYTKAAWSTEEIVPENHPFRFGKAADVSADGTVLILSHPEEPRIYFFRLVDEAWTLDTEWNMPADVLPDSNVAKTRGRIRVSADGQLMCFVAKATKSTSKIFFVRYNKDEEKWLTDTSDLAFIEFEHNSTEEMRLQAMHNALEMYLDTEHQQLIVMTVGRYEHESNHVMVYTWSY